MILSTGLKFNRAIPVLLSNFDGLNTFIFFQKDFSVGDSFMKR